MAEQGSTVGVTSRLQIAFLGKTNAGKSSLINAVVGHSVALVSDVAGTTTDPVYKSMELLPLGAVSFIDTAGLDDQSELGVERLRKTAQVLGSVQVVVIVVRSDDENLQTEREYIQLFNERAMKIFIAYNNFGAGPRIDSPLGEKWVNVDARSGQGIDDLKKLIIDNCNTANSVSLIEGLVSEFDTVMLVVPEIIEAPRSRLPMIHVALFRDILDRGARLVAVKAHEIKQTLTELKQSPKFVISENSEFEKAKAELPTDIQHYSISMLQARAVR